MSLKVSVLTVERAQMEELGVMDRELVVSRVRRVKLK